MEIILLFVILFVCVTISVPIGFSLAAATVTCFMLYTNTSLLQIAQYLTSGLDSFPMLAIPILFLPALS